MHLTILSHYLWQALRTTGSQLALLLGPGLVLAFVMHLLSGFIARNACRLLGRAPFLLLFGWLGTMVHEGGHALFCLLFGHRITAIKWFDLRGTDGSLGYVRHRFDQRSLYQRSGQFFIGIGPILLGTALIYAAARYLLGAELLAPLGHAADGRSLSAMAQSFLHGGQNMVAALFTPRNLASWQLYLFLYLSFAVGSAISLSPQDIRGALSGFVVLVGLLLLFNVVTGWLGSVPAGFSGGLLRICSVLYLTMLFAILMNALVAAALLVATLVSRAVRS